MDRFLEEKKDIRELGKIKIAAIGSETARSISKRGLSVDLVPKKFVAESLIDEFKKRRINNTKILIPRAKGSRRILIDGLLKLKNDVKEIFVYESLIPKKNIKENVKKNIINNNIYAITLQVRQLLIIFLNS